jgi:hypothetical protein
LIAWYIVPETGPATVTSSPGFNSNWGEVAVLPWVFLITTLLIKKAVKGESQRPAGNIIVSGELLTTVDNIQICCQPLHLLARDECLLSQLQSLLNLQSSWFWKVKSMHIDLGPMEN